MVQWIWNFLIKLILFLPCTASSEDYSGTSSWWSSSAIQFMDLPSSVFFFSLTSFVKVFFRKFACRIIQFVYYKITQSHIQVGYQKKISCKLVHLLFRPFKSCLCSMYKIMVWFFLLDNILWIRLVLISNSQFGD